MTELEFLDTLTELAKVYGWEGDYIEIHSFLEWAHKQYCIKPPDLECYHPEDE